MSLVPPLQPTGSFHLQANTARKFRQDLRHIFTQRDADLFGVIEARLRNYCKENGDSMSKGTFTRAVRSLATRVEYNEAGLLETAMKIYEECKEGTALPSPPIIMGSTSGKKRARDESPGRDQSKGGAHSYDSTMATFSMEAAAADLSFGFGYGGVF